MASFSVFHGTSVLVLAYHVMKYLCPNGHDIISIAGCGFGFYVLKGALRGAYLNRC